MRALLDMQHELLSSTDRHVLLALRVRVGDNGRCWPTQKRISRDTGLSERTVRECTAKLQRLGVIRTSRAENNGRQKIYKIAGVERRVSPGTTGGRVSDNRSNTGKSRRETGTPCRLIPAPRAARMNQPNVKEGNYAVHGLPAPQHKSDPKDVRTCTPQQMRDLIKGLSSEANGCHGA